MGVTKGLAGIKFSTSPKRNGSIRHKDTSNHIMATNPNKSLNEKKGWNEIL